MQLMQLVLLTSLPTLRKMIKARINWLSARATVQALMPLYGDDEVKCWIADAEGEERRWERMFWHHNKVLGLDKTALRDLGLWGATK